MGILPTVFLWGLTIFRVAWICETSMLSEGRQSHVSETGLELSM